MVPQLLPPMKNRCPGPCHSRTTAEQLRQAVAEIPFPITAGVGTSGVALDTSPAMGDTQLIDDLISTCDAAMYEAKRAGGNQVCHYPALVPRGAR
jgi:GGDEF domain-containing protein